jgi:hypothetical protein
MGNVHKQQKFKDYFRMQLWPLLRYGHRFRLERLRKTAKNSIQCSRYPGRGSNRIYPEYKSGALVLDAIIFGDEWVDVWEGWMNRRMKHLSENRLQTNTERDYEMSILKYRYVTFHIIAFSSFWQTTMTQIRDIRMNQRHESHIRTPCSARHPDLIFSISSLLKTTYIIFVKMETHFTDNMWFKF